MIEAVENRAAGTFRLRPVGMVIGSHHGVCAGTFTTRLFSSSGTRAWNT